MADHKVYVVLPVYDEAECIEELLGRIDAALRDADLAYQVVLIDDGSRDATPEIVERCARSLPILVRRHPANAGLGATIRDGLMLAAELAGEGDVIVTLDADGTQPPDLIPSMCERVRAGCDVVVASRYQPGAQVVGVPLSRRFLSRAASWIFRGLFRIRGVRDFTCGFRAYRAQVLQRALEDYGDAFFDQDGFQCMVDILLKLRGRGLRFGEVPLVLRYDLKAGDTKMEVGRTVVQTLLLAARRLREG